MAGLFVKDMRLLMKNKQVFVIFFVMAIIMGLSMDGTFFVAYLTFLGGIYAISTISYDEMDKGFAFLMTLPIDAKTYVYEKYGFCSVMGIIAWGISVVILFLNNLRKGLPVGSLEQLIEMFVFVPCMLIFLDIMIPVQLKFGIEKSRIALAVFAGGIVVLAFGAKSFAERTGAEMPAFLEKLDLMPVSGIIAFFVGLAAICTVISIVCSIRVMEHKQY